MKLINTIVLIFTLSTACQFVSGQITDGKMTESYFYPPLSGEIFYPSFSYIGSQYYIDEWSEGIIILESGEKASNLQLRYNGFLDELIWMKTPSYQQVKLDKYLIKEFSLYPKEGQRPLIFRRISVNLPPFKTKTEIFAQILYDDAISLYAFRRVTITRRVNRKMETGNFEFVLIEPDYLYFINIPGAESIFLSTISRRNLYNAFPEMKQEIRAIFNQPRGNLTNEERFAMIVKKLNELF